jgi:hypothetical protein
VLDALAMGWIARHQTSAGSLARRLVWREAPPRVNEHVVSLFVIRRDGGGYAVIDDAQSAGELAEASQRTPERVTAASYWAGTWRTGFWSPLRERSLSRVESFSLATGAQPRDEADVAAARTAVAGWLAAHGREDAAAAVHAGDFNTTRLLWWGWLHDAVVLLLAGAFVVTLARLPWTLRDRTVRGLLSRGRCPRCLYDLSGIQGSPRRCPECGRAWDMLLCRPAGSAPG